MYTPTRVQLPVTMCLVLIAASVQLNEYDSCAIADACKQQSIQGNTGSVIRHACGHVN